MSHEVKVKGRSFDMGLVGNLLQRCSVFTSVKWAHAVADSEVSVVCFTLLP